MRTPVPSATNSSYNVLAGRHLAQPSGENLEVSMGVVRTSMAMKRGWFNSFHLVSTSFM